MVIKEKYDVYTFEFLLWISYERLVWGSSQKRLNACLNPENPDTANSRCCRGITVCSGRIAWMDAAGDQENFAHRLYLDNTIGILRIRTARRNIQAHPSVFAINTSAVCTRL